MADGTTAAALQRPSARTLAEAHELLTRMTRINADIRAIEEEAAIKTAADRRVISEAEERIAPVLAEAKLKLDPLKKEAQEVGEGFRRFTERHPKLLPPPADRLKTLTFNTGHTYLRQEIGLKVVTKGKNDDAAIEEIKAKGWEADFIEYKPFLRRNELKRTEHRQRVEELTCLTLRMTRKITIGLPNGIQFIGKDDDRGKFSWEFES
ncbi:MAG TPA: host-nuclease inhibitor Gam family protein [Candidatus Paceibacterota bacterium]|nr:host-nuclease inhibitor Gam family protein [Candidatus Paceibacterota bacterium]